ncbi:monofunctional biosynthetic peptidoglycan transglycosylase [Mesosutterella sp. OilRF-GAM-744-9]|uniref:Biosynthetic peptidoglycan transglycosylase n=1 Tax=Mesosutterella porci TaxID=2915351 RepID=A0ABS9MRS5_9BURK|nr:monofunctional biosynthetic peptidoglycan transglycosylase [Mesosutterella sp. oilRF-744-WT-GAM-9]MCG5031304.1 monofunctional biosynthetic peptidoglycan transglycosylase [Mesosutterella sp. oilRF-744-WT-GAM-9]MCI6530622.1 monofunctional biosynthetic peptidoglycan transglycosylase [Mesosutterella sp.]
MTGALRAFLRHPARNALLALAAAALLWHIFILGEAAAYRWVNPTMTPYMKLERARIAAEGRRVPFRHEWIPLSRMGPNIKRAVIASEDQKFLHHDGVDWDALELEMEKHLEKGRGGGASTITQQVVKNVFLTHEHSYIRKAREILISLALDRLWPKSRILEVYLNTAEFGEGIFGVQSAAKYYFGCSASALTEAQAAFLAAILPRPRYYQVHRGSAFIRRKAARIEYYMQRTPLRAGGENLAR